MENKARGEVIAQIKGETRVLSLSLGNLAQLESVLSTGSLLKFVERLDEGKALLIDVLHIISAGCNGDGRDSVSPDEIYLDGGIVEAYTLAATLLQRSFCCSSTNIMDSGNI